MLPKVIVVGGLLVAGLIGYSFFTKPTSALTWGTTQINCLPDGHSGATYHTHTKLTIIVDEVPELIPSHIGDTPDCMAEVHTHDASGTVHVEGVAEKQFTLGDFFAVWGKNLERDGYVLRASQNSTPIADPASLVLTDGSTIVLMYTREGAAES